jgi:cyclohexadieny/prephenate dehydrogenase
MQIETMDAEHHDRVLAMTSHIPQLIAYSIVSTATELETNLKDEVIKYSAAGFRDFTRLAGSDPIMWRDVYSLNKDAVLEMLSKFMKDLSTLQKAIRNNDLSFLEETFRTTRKVRKTIEELGQAGSFDPRENKKK